MRFIETSDYDAMSAQAAALLADRLKAQPDTVFALPTGSTPLGTYSCLAAMHAEDGLDFSKATFFNVDEYVGMAPDSAQGYFRFLRDNLYSKVNAVHVFAPDGLAAVPASAAEAYEKRINDAGGIGFAFLGIGRNGHVGFNEPAANLPCPTHCVQLSEDTINANARFFSGVSSVPKQAITIGIGTIMHADQIVLVASGDKHDAIDRLRSSNDVSTEFPASLLYLHPNVTVVTSP